MIMKKNQLIIHIAFRFAYMSDPNKPFLLMVLDNDKINSLPDAKTTILLNLMD